MGKRFGITRPIVAPLLAVGGVILSHYSVAAQTLPIRPPVPPLQAVIRYQEAADYSWQESILYDGDRFVIEGPASKEIGGSLPEPVQKGVFRYICEGKKMYPFGAVSLIWRYDPSKKVAYLSDLSCRAIVETLIEKEGKEYVSHTYTIPRDLDVFGLGDQIPTVARAYKFRHPLLEPIIGQKLGERKIAGRQCVVFVVKSLSDGQNFQTAIDLQNHLMLAVDFDFTGQGTRLPPRRRRMEVQSLVIYRQPIPPSRFTLPPGTTVYLPLTARNIALPNGVKRRTLTGKFAGAGIVHNF